jgi:hypothetical protein
MWLLAPVMARFMGFSLMGLYRRRALALIAHINMITMIFQIFSCLFRQSLDMYIGKNIERLSMFIV